MTYLGLSPASLWVPLACKRRVCFGLRRTFWMVVEFSNWWLTFSWWWGY